MIQKCANPGCSCEFRYASEGRLFHFDAGRHREASAPSGPARAGAGSRTVFYWLCEGCAARYALHFSAEGGLHLVPLDATEQHADGSACPNCSMLGDEVDR